MNENIVFVFPGQGAQYVGMARDLFKKYAVVRHTFEEVCDISHKNITQACFNGPQEILNKPEFTSLGTLAHSVSIARIIESYFNAPLYKIAYAVTGHSMGQYSALHCAGSLSFEDTVKLLSARSTYMSMTSAEGGGMACIVGLDKDAVEMCLMAATGRGFASISNHNAKDQFTISGQSDALDAVIERAKEKGAKIAKKLNVSVPAHCALMENAKILLNHRLESINLVSPKTRWFSNQSAQILSDPQDVKSALIGQMTQGVRWLDIMEKFPEHNITSAYELGPGRTLTGLINRAKVGVVARKTNSLTNVINMLTCLSQSIKR